MAFRSGNTFGDATKCFFISLLMLNPFAACTKNRSQNPAPVAAVSYYVDSENGNDSYSGTDEGHPWKSLSRVESASLHPGDTVHFRRGAAFVGPLVVKSSGDKDHLIVLTDYGNPADPAPSFTNPVFKQDNFGNGIRVLGSYVCVENLYFHHTAAFVPGDYDTGGGWAVWEMGAIHIGRNAEHCIVQHNEIEDCVAGIKSNGAHTLIRDNYVHDCNRVLAEWDWGPIGIWLGADYQEVEGNRVFNYRAEDPRIHWQHGSGGGADGGAFEIDDARYDKTHISIHHNYTRDCQGFLEVTWSDVKSHPDYSGFSIHHNISDDYQQFLALWAGKDCEIDNNTIVRRKVNANDWGVFNIAEDNGRNKIRNNLIITEKNIPIFNTGLDSDHHPDDLIQYNLYYAASGSLNMGKEGPGEPAVFGDPHLLNYAAAQQPEDFSIVAGSAAIDRGTALGYTSDFVQTPVPQGQGADIGAFEYK
jgi:hypothetical protein